MTAPSLEYLQSLIPDIDHPDLNAMRACLHAKKINIPVRLFNNGTEVYAAEVRMIGHTHSLYKAALDAVCDSIATRAPALEWDHVSFHSDKKFTKAEMSQPASSLSDFISAYRKTGFLAARMDVMHGLEKIHEATDHAAAKAAFDENILRLCASIISTSIDVTPDATYAPAPRKGILQRFIPKF